MFNCVLNFKKLRGYWDISFSSKIKVTKPNGNYVFQWQSNVLLMFHTLIIQEKVGEYKFEIMFLFFTHVRQSTFNNYR